MKTSIFLTLLFCLITLSTQQVTTGFATTGSYEPVTTGFGNSGFVTTGSYEPVTTAQVTTGVVTTAPATTGQVVTGVATTGVVTTGTTGTTGSYEPVTTAQVTTGVVTTAPATTGQVITGVATTGVVTTGTTGSYEPVTTAQVTTGVITTATTGPVTTGVVTTGTYEPVTTGAATTASVTTSPGTTGAITTGIATTGTTGWYQPVTTGAVTGVATTGSSVTPNTTYLACQSGYFYDSYYGYCYIPSYVYCNTPSVLFNTTTNPPRLDPNYMISSNLRLRVLQSVTMNRVVTSIRVGTNTSSYCNYPGPYWSKNVVNWIPYSLSACDDEYTTYIPWSVASTCGFTRSYTTTTATLSGSLTVNFQDTVTLPDGSQVFRQTSSSLPFRLNFPRQVTVSTSNLIYGQELLYAVVSQSYNEANGTLTVQLLTRVSGGNRLTNIMETKSPANITVTAFMLTDCASNSSPCEQTWRILVSQSINSSRCNFDGTYSFNFTNGLSSSTDFVSFSVASGNICPTDASGSVSASLTSYSQFNNSFSNPTTLAYEDSPIYYEMYVYSDSGIQDVTLTRVVATSGNGVPSTLFQNGIAYISSFGTTKLGGSGTYYRVEFHFAFSESWYGTIPTLSYMNSTVTAYATITYDAMQKKEIAIRLGSPDGDQDVSLDMKVVAAPSSVAEVSKGSSLFYSVFLVILMAAVLF